MLVLASSGALAPADEIKLGGFWINNISIEGIEDGQVVYYNRIGTEVRRPLGVVEGVRLSAYPHLGKAHQAIADGDDRAALQALKRVRNKASASWLRHWVSYMLIKVYDRLGMAVEAVDEYLLSMIEGAPPVFLTHLPTESIQNAPADVKEAVRHRITIAMDLVNPPIPPTLQEMLNAAANDSGHSGDENTNTHPANGQTTPTGSRQPETATTPIESSLTLPVALDIGDTITKRLLYGRYEEALEWARKSLKSDKRQIPMRLYQQGMAQMGLAEAENDQSKHLDAALSFMSVVAYFPQSSYAGPCLVEAGLIHSKMGRSDIATRLYHKAALLIDHQNDLRYATRLEQLIDALENHKQ